MVTPPYSTRTIYIYIDIYIQSTYCNIQNIYNTNTPLPTSRWKISDRYILPQKNDTFGIGFYKNFTDNKRGDIDYPLLIYPLVN